MRFSVGCALPYNWSGVIFSLSQVQNFLGDERDSATFKPPNRSGHIPLLATPLWIFWLAGHAEKVVTFLNQISQTKTSFGGLNKAFFHHLRHNNAGHNNVQFFCIFWSTIRKYKADFQYLTQRLTTNLKTSSSQNSF
jgi:hypothetical protein